MSWNAKGKFFNHRDCRMLAALAFLCLSSLLLFQPDGRHRVVARGILPNLDFRALGNHWTGSDAGIRISQGPPATLLFSNDGRRQTFIAQPLPNPRHYANIRVAVDIKVDKILPGPAWWQQASVLLMSWDDKQQRMTYWPSEIVQLSGTRPWARYKAVIPVAENAREIKLYILNGGKSGLLQIRNLQMRPKNMSTHLET